MQPPEATENFLFKLWPWIESNLKQLLYGTAIVLIVVFVLSFYSWRRNQREVEAGEAVTKIFLSNNGNPYAEAFLKIAADYSGTRAGQRALLQGASALFVSGKYPEAQAQFQKYFNNYSDNDLSSEATLGIAACLDAQGQGDAAAREYQKAVNTTSEPSVALSARFALGTINERQGKLSDAQKFYQEIIRTAPESSVATEAGLRMTDWKSTAHASSAPAPSAVNTPFNLLNH